MTVALWVAVMAVQMAGYLGIQKVAMKVGSMEEMTVGMKVDMKVHLKAAQKAQLTVVTKVGMMAD